MSQQYQNNMYYIPTKEEFVQGFEFEVRTIKAGDIIAYYPNEDRKVYAEKDVWVKSKVWWHRELNKEFVEINFGDVSLKYKEIHIDLLPPFNIDTYLKNGMIRALKTI